MWGHGMTGLSIRKVLGAVFVAYMFLKLVFSGGHFNAGGLVVFVLLLFWGVCGIALWRWIRRPIEVVVVRDERRR